MFNETASANIDGLQEAGTHVIKIKYKPRKHFLVLHNSQKRFKFVVAHRRCGKTVALINEMIKQAMLNPRQFPVPRYGYVGPSFAQAKDLVWGYLKHYTSTIPGVEFSEGELQCRLPNGALINLYGGSSAYQRMRGLYFDGIVLDEFAMLNPLVLGTVVRPCLADYRGWCVASGTSNGDDHFHELKKRAERETSIWDVFIMPVTETDALHPDEVTEMTKDMSAEEFAREMLCRFDAPIEGAYFARYINEAQAANRICSVPHDPEGLVFTSWDLGMDDELVVWFWQVGGKAYHLIDVLVTSNKGIPEVAQMLSGNYPDDPKPHEHRKKYNYSVHVMPQDVKVRELGTGKSRYEVACTVLPGIVFIMPYHRVEDGIEAVKNTLPICYFDAERCEHGISALRNYHKSKTGNPVHNWASHPADGFRAGAVSLNMIQSLIGSGTMNKAMNGPLKRKVRGVR